jgi:hypothetical protein
VRSCRRRTTPSPPRHTRTRPTHAWVGCL